MSSQQQMISVSTDFKSLKSTPQLPGWRVSLVKRRKHMIPYGNIVSPDAEKHQEKKKTKRKGKVKEDAAVKPYANPLLTPWQKEFAKEVNQGNNVVVGSVTSTGKTWSAILITAHEVLSRDDATALIISPNSEVMRDTVRDIETWHTKRYIHAKTAISTITRNYMTYHPSRNGPSSQIVVVAIDSAVEFLTDPSNQRFMEKLRIAVFDEVHIPTISHAAWWLQFIPHSSQLLFLSATLGDPVQVKNIVDRMQELDKTRPRKTTIITREIRPIPLQLVTFRGCNTPENGSTDKSLSRTGRLKCLIDPFGPTVRDIKSIVGNKVSIPEDRDGQYYMGRDVVKENYDTVLKKNKEGLQEIVTDPTPQNIYNLICYLFANEMQPCMVFSATTESAKKLAVGILGYIGKLEKEDPEVRKAYKLYDSYLNKQKKKDDKEDKDKWKQETIEESSTRGVDLGTITRSLQKWKFPGDFRVEGKLRGVDQWVIDCLEVGIGVYVSSMPTYMRHKVFDAVKKGDIKIMIADSTAAVGVNLPFRTSIICGAVPHHLYKQASGRAGRRGMDNKGYVVHMMDPRQIQDYIYQKESDVVLKMPKRLAFTDIIRLHTPYNLANAVEPDLKDVRKKRERLRLMELTFPPDTPSSTINPYNKLIVENYLKNISQEERQVYENRVQWMVKEQWHYHRMTNLFKSVYFDESIIILKLMITGKLKLLNPQHFIMLCSLLMFRVEFSKEKDDGNDFYIPDFTDSGIPDLMKGLTVWGKRYNIDMRVDVPVHKFLYSYFYEGILYLKYLDEINQFGEWLYVLKRLVDMCAPDTSAGCSDLTYSLFNKVDSVYIAATSRQMEIRQ